MSRTHAILDLLAGFDPERTLSRMIQALAKACHAAGNAIEVPPQVMDTLRQCVEEGATVHQSPGAIDRIVLAPQAAVFLMEHGARPGPGWVLELRRWVEGSLHSGNRLPASTHPANANEWLHRAVRMAITLSPGMDWMMVYKSEISGTREVFIDRLSMRDKDLVRHLRDARVHANIPLVPLHGGRSLYTYLLADVLDEYPRHRLLWQDLGTDQVARDLLDKGADPGLIWASNDIVSRDDPFLVRALFKDPGLVHALLDKGAVVSDRVVDDLGRALVDRQRRLLPGPATYAALRALVDRMPPGLDLDTHEVPEAEGRSLGDVIDQVMPGVLQSWRASHQAHLLTRATLTPDQTNAVRRL